SAPVAAERTAGSMPDPRQVKLLGVPKDERTVKGGTSVLLDQAVQSILPPGYSLRLMGNGNWASTQVDWTEGKAWTDALREMLGYAPDVVAEVVVGAKTVILRPRRPLLDGEAPPATPRKSVARSKEAQPAPHVDSRAAVKAPEPSPEPAPPPAPAWQVSLEDRTVKNVIARWSQRAGWQLNWEIGYDYPVLATAAINGTFEEAVESLVKSVGYSDAPITAVFYTGNRVIRVVAKGVVR
ncbi:MAG TPA: toxin co-regulated pilus biosynthesis Q family protein, partial [Noviherbaspirillum sp.]